MYNRTKVEEELLQGINQPGASSHGEDNEKRRYANYGDAFGRLESEDKIISLIEDLEAYSGKDLQDMEFIPPKFVIADLLPEGCSTLSGPPKSGKSWLALLMAISGSLGIPVIGFESVKGNVLYLSLEDSFSRLKGRMEALLGNDPWPENLVLSTRSRGIKTGLFQQIENLEAKKKIKFDFIIIDTLQKVKPPQKNKSDDYAEIYNLIGELDTYGREKGTAILVIHHTRKNNGKDTDPFDDALGSVGLQGAVTTMMVLRLDRRENIAKLHATGKDIESCEKSLERVGVRWISLEDKNPEKSDFYENNPLRKAVLQILETEESGMYETTKENLRTLVHSITRKSMYTSVYQLTDELNLLKPLFWIRDSIIYRDSSNKPVKKDGTSKRLISFQKIIKK